MHIDGPVANLLMGVAPKKSSGLRVCFLLLLGASILSVSAMAAPEKGGKPTTTQAAKTAPGDFVGSETCATCHEEVAKKFSSNPHTKIAELHGKSGVTCEGCHGAGKAHVDGGGDTSKIFNPSKASAQEVNETCLTCHAAKHQNFDRGEHAKAKLSCISCHSVHASGSGADPVTRLLASQSPSFRPSETEHLLKAPQPNLCYQCHADQKAQFSMPFHHKVNEGAVSCSDCHDPHGTPNKNNLKNAADQSAICTKCHTETRGPFVFEHAAVKAEGCTGCHTPHGSQNARLLTMPNITTLCQQCHSPVANGTVHGLGKGSASATPCINCHTMIHGSNGSPAFIR